MSTVAEALPTLDLRETRRVPLSRLVRVELRKMSDTRAGMWLLIGIGVLTAGIMTIFFINAEQADRTFENFMAIAASPQAFLLPVLGILLVTSEWTQRTALVTFTLEPVRFRLLTAKMIAALLFGLAAVVLALVIAAAATALGGSEGAWNNVGFDEVGKYGLLQASSIVQGLAFGLVFLNSAGAIATFFVLPAAFGIVTSLWKVLADIGPWIDINTASGPLLEVENLTGEEWAHFAVATLLWVVLPLIVGIFRVLRKELK